MMTMFTKALLSSLVGLFAVACHASEEFKQVLCNVDESSDVAIIWVDDESKPKGLRFNVQFEQNSIVFRLPPEFYAPGWQQIEEIQMDFPNKESLSGMLRVHLHNTDGSHYVQVVGKVERSCWHSVDAFIRHRIVSQGVKVNLREVN
jgi:hypothetical protein